MELAAGHLLDAAVGKAVTEGRNLVSRGAELLQQATHNLQKARRRQQCTRRIDRLRLLESLLRHLDSNRLSPRVFVQPLGGRNILTAKYDKACSDFQHVCQKIYDFVCPDTSSMNLWARAVSADELFRTEDAVMLEIRQTCRQSMDAESFRHLVDLHRNFADTSDRFCSVEELTSEEIRQNDDDSRADDAVMRSQMLMAALGNTCILLYVTVWRMYLLFTTRESPMFTRQGQMKAGSWRVVMLVNTIHTFLVGWALRILRGDVGIVDGDKLSFLMKLWLHNSWELWNDSFFNFGCVDGFPVKEVFYGVSLTGIEITSGPHHLLFGALLVHIYAFWALLGVLTLLSASQAHELLKEGTEKEVLVLFSTLMVLVVLFLCCVVLAQSAEDETLLQGLYRLIRSLSGTRSMNHQACSARQA
eukprot:CAMPEP_0185710170 /NCGR_PEP_ID=MMETSP1164-20130828/30149_1 /TAXON_ID=1104430 /ORGANISM="Chrysoreinhardia sp, Strain CCMP2950" /LENGTH=416 /DNA_ID=CAMNT_0028377673 /DNA_START=114 /DNA_END=1364 /DNA_ORIENTATION=-